MICLTILPKNIQELKSQFAVGCSLGDMVEIRLDYIGRAGFSCLKDATQGYVVATCRRREDGGFFDGSEDERLKILGEASGFPGVLVDVELDVLERVSIDWPLGRILASYHDFQSTPAGLQDIYDRLRATRAAKIKMATTARNAEDCVRILQLVKKADGYLTAHCMGGRGIASRVLGKKYGTCWTYASLEGENIAPGMLSVSQLKGIYRYEKINRDTRVFGIIGTPLGHSLSPAFHNAEFEHAGLNALYVPFETDDPGDVVSAKTFLNLGGLSVTSPFKESVIEHLDCLDDSARVIGSVNTVLFNESSCGYNTDAPAIEDVILKVIREEWPSLDGKTYAVLGSGGAARAALAALGNIYKNNPGGKHVMVVARNPKTGKQLAENFGAEYVDKSSFFDRDYDMLINATPVGMAPEENVLPIENDALRHHKIVFDMIYKPGVTKLLFEAERRGCSVINGMAMFLAQAELQSSLFRSVPGL